MSCLKKWPQTCVAKLIGETHPKSQTLISLFYIRRFNKVQLLKKYFSYTIESNLNITYVTSFSVFLTEVTVSIGIKQVNRMIASIS